MKDNELIPIEKEPFNYDSSGVQVVRHKGRRSKASFPLKRLIIFVSICLVVLVVYHFYPIIQGYFQSFLPHGTDISSNSESKAEETLNSIFADNSFSQDTNSTINSSPLVPDTNESVYGFVDTPTAKTELKNKSQLSISLNDYTFNKEALNEIYEKHGSASPVVLITSFSPYEAYSNGENYTQGGLFYDVNTNVSTIGNVICKSLSENGVNAIYLNKLYYDTLLELSKEYSKYVKSIISAFPSIRYVFDISRGIEINNDMSMNKYTYKSNDISYASVGIVVGTSDTLLTENQKSNLSFAFDFADFSSKENEGFIHHVTLSPVPLFQDIEPVCIRFDIGNFSNSFEEASSSANLLSSIICEYIK